jgi:hypothetical protein
MQVQLGFTGFVSGVPNIVLQYYCFDFSEKNNEKKTDLLNFLALKMKTG